VTDESTGYDRIAKGYARWWAPVLAPAVAELLDDVARTLTGRERLLDIGTGTGQLALGALARWPAATVAGVDASAGMRELADAQADARLGPADRHRFQTVTALADAMPFEDGTFDAALSSFVLQLVPNRARALREARRVLRPGGLLGYVSWLDDAGRFLPDIIFDEVLAASGLEERGTDGRSGDVPSVERAAGELRRAGFARVAARPGWLTHRFSVEGYISFLTEFDEETLFDELGPDVRERLLTALRHRLTALSRGEMTMRFPIVFAMGRRSR
jgi:SAM-dependent methyltransferase